MGLNQPQPLRSELILRGQLQDLDINTLLSALKLGRQYITLEVFDTAGECTGIVSLKAGRVVSASVGGYTGAEAVRRLLESREPAEFRVQLQPSDAYDAYADQEPVGTISELTRRADESEVRPLTARTRVLQGLLSGRLNFTDVLHAVAFTRQHVTVELNDGAGNILGEVQVKAGKVLSARAGNSVDLHALRELLDAPAGSTFVLFTDTLSVAQLRPLGSLVEVLDRIQQSRLDVPTAQSNGLRKTLPPPLPRLQRQTEAPRRVRILEGSLEEFELAQVLRVLSTSRQHFELHVRDEAAQTVGVIEVKAGMVVGASTDASGGQGKLDGLPAAQELLRASRGRFVALRRTDQTGDRAALVSVSELLQPKAAARETTEDTDVTEAFDDNTQALSLTGAVISEEAPAAATPKPIPVLDGKIGDLDVSSILHVAGASRQYTCVHIFDDQRTPLGVIHLKGGQVVRAKAQDVTGVAAVRRLLHCPRDFSFLVQRYPHAPEVTSSIGSIGSVLARASTQTGSFPASRASTPSPQPRPSATAFTPLTQNTQTRARSNDAPSSSWMGGAVLGAGFVLLGGIATAIVLRSPALNTSVSAVSSAPEESASARTAAAKGLAAPSGEPPADTPATAAPSDGANPDIAKPPVAAEALSRAAIASYQAGLKQLGYETGAIDGVVGPRTAAAIKAFQYAEHLTVDGTLSGPTRAVLTRRIEEP